MKIILKIICLLAVFLFVVFLYHRYRLKVEENYSDQDFRYIDINGRQMAVKIAGQGEEKTLVFLSGGGTCSPILDFKSLYDLLDKRYCIIVIEKFGYGYSDDVDGPRDVATILSESRLALEEVGVKGPYYLVPHSMSGIQALYWAQQYPEEVVGIIGLDMALPASYQAMDIHPWLLNMVHFSSVSGLIRLIPGIAESDAINHGTLTESEQEIYRSIFYRKTMNATMVQENRDIQESALKVQADSIPEIPYLLFVSNGSGTGFDQGTWRGYQREFANSVKQVELIELDVPHYLHDYAYQEIAQKITEFLTEQ